MPEIKLYGEIQPGMSQEVKAALEAAAPGEELVVRIDSEGGSVFEGFSIYDAIAGYQGPKRSVIESAAFSIASLIALACDEVEITANGYMMIHNPYTLTEGDDQQLARQAQLLSKLKNTMAKVYQQRTGKSEDEVLAIMQQESFFNAQEAVAIGLVDNVLARSQETRTKLARFKNVPQRVVAALWAGHAADELLTQKDDPPMAEQPQKTPATVAQIKKNFPKAKAEFIVKAMEEEMTMEEVGAAMLKSLQAENEELQAKLAAMEEEQAQALEVEVSPDEEEEPDAAAQAQAQEEEEPEAKAKRRGVKPVARAASVPKLAAKARWHQCVEEQVKSGLPRARAIARVDQLHPGLREEMLAEVNA